MSSNEPHPGDPSTTLTLPAWPPSSLTVAQIGHLSHLATDYALSHGIVYRPLPLKRDAAAPPPYDSVIHAPFSLVPSPFPRTLFNYAQSLQPTYDVLYASIASSPRFLENVVGGSVAKVDSFQAALWRIYQRLQADPDAASRQKLALGLFRSDYLLHQPDAADSGSEAQLQLKQVEFNTISASFGALCTKVAGLHRHVAKHSSGYFGAEQGKLANLDNLPDNQALDVLASGLAAAHRAYVSQRGLAAPPKAESQEPLSRSPVVLFVVQEHERNAFDQRAIEQELSSAHQIPVLRQTFTQLMRSARLVGPDRRLVVTPPWSTAAAAATNGNEEHEDDIEVSVVYYRAGYGPSDYPTEAEWDLREKLERSYAIKCPTVAMQLAGAKKVQQVLAEEGVTERLLDSVKTSGGTRVTSDDAARVRASYTDLYPLDDSTLGQQALELATTQPQRFVMKPQREGGGNNVYRDDIPPALAQMEEADRQADAASSNVGVKTREGYILMSLIQPPSGVGNWLVKASTNPSSADSGAEAGAGAGSGAVLARDVVSELGVYGSVLYTSGAGEGEVEVQHHTSGGFLLRTKARESDEGGVAVGFSVIDSPLLV